MIVCGLMGVAGRGLFSLHLRVCFLFQCNVTQLVLHDCVYHIWNEMQLIKRVSVSLQCESSLDGQRGRCWCVNSWNGKKILGSTDLPADAECP